MKVRVVPTGKAIEKSLDLACEIFNRVSAASKLLWLSYRCPIIICDLRATKALKGEFGHKHADESHGQVRALRYAHALGVGFRRSIIVPIESKTPRYRSNFGESKRVGWSREQRLKEIV